jgi:hypothetical protein
LRGGVSCWHDTVDDPRGRRDVNGLFILGVAAAGCAIGYLWLHRIIRADAEPDQRAWRYRERD